jgi:hypothetical protein
MKQHKFFERYLNNDLNKLSKQLKIRYDLIEKAKVSGVTPVGQKEYWMESGSISTVKWRQYNVFQFHIPEIYNLYVAISEMVKEACNYYEIDFSSQKYILQGWFNINTKQGGKLDWHDHGDPYAPNFHGYYCVNAEPSTTQYMLFNNKENIVDNLNKNNRAILSEMGHPHSMNDWNWDGERITVAYDVVPMERMPKSYEMEQHWIPLI